MFFSRASVLVVSGVFAGALYCQGSPTWSRDIDTMARQGRGTPEGRAAWDRLAAGGPELLVPLLKAMNTTDSVAANWARTAFESVLAKNLKDNRSAVDIEAILAFAQEAKNHGRARRLALDVVETQRPGTAAKWYPGWLDDPEFRYEAVDLLLKQARNELKSDQKSQALADFQKAFNAARDVPQARAAAAGLLEFGEKASVARHFGFLTDWFLLGPFDGQGQKGFHRVYPPEKSAFDPLAEFDGQLGKVRWKRHQVQEPSPTSGTKHQALVNLRDREALGDADDAVAFAFTTFTVPKAQEVEFRGAADDHLVVYVNGVRAFGFEEWRNGVRLDRHRFKANLQEGKNTVLVKISQSAAPNTEPNWEFFLRLADASGKGIPFENALPMVAK